MENNLYDVIIIGSGPAGLTAAIYTTRASLKTLVVAGRVWGGQLMLTTLVENFPGFPKGVMGPDLMLAIRKQAEFHGARLIESNFKTADFSKQPFEIATDDDEKFYSKSVILATGADTKWLDVPGEKEKIGRGISSCAPCDAPFYKNKNVLVIGGGDSAMEEALVLSKFANHIWVVHRKDSLRASQVMQDKAFENPKIDFIWNTQVLQILGENKVEKAKLSSKLKFKPACRAGRSAKLGVKVQNKDKEVSVEEIGGRVLERNDQEIIWEFPIGGIFVAIGHNPNSQVFKGIETDEKGFIKVFNHTRTNIEGVFVAGDVHDSEYKQAITAAGFGCMAALEAGKWLESRTD